MRAERSRLERGTAGGEDLGQYGQDLVLAQDQHVFAVDADVRARVLSEQDLVADLDVEGDLRAVLQDLAVAGGEDFAFPAFRRVWG
jgi:hypothetical protein